jgi:hypothetical protein
MQEIDEDSGNENVLYKGEISIPAPRAAAITLLIAIQRSIPIEVFDPRNYWSIFESRVRASAIQNVTLHTCFEQMKRKLQIERINSNLVEIIRIIEGDESDAVLEEIRKHPALLIAHVRVAQQERKDAYQEKIALSEGVEL